MFGFLFLAPYARTARYNVFFFLAPYARTTRYEEAFCLKAKNGLGRFASSALPHFKNIMQLYKIRWVISFL